MIYIYLIIWSVNFFSHAKSVLQYFELIYKIGVNLFDYNVTWTNSDAPSVSEKYLLIINKIKI